MGTRVWMENGRAYREPLLQISLGHSVQRVEERGVGRLVHFGFYFWHFSLTKASKPEAGTLYLDFLIIISLFHFFNQVHFFLSLWCRAFFPFYWKILTTDNFVLGGCLVNCSEASGHIIICTLKSVGPCFLALWCTGEKSCIKLELMLS